MKDDADKCFKFLTEDDDGEEIVTCRLLNEELPDGDYNLYECENGDCRRCIIPLYDVMDRIKSILDSIDSEYCKHRHRIF